MCHFHGSSCCLWFAVSSLWLIYLCANLCLLLWTRVHGSVVRAVDCKSAGPWFNSGWRSWFTFMTWSSNQTIQMINIMSPITTSIRTITRMSAKIFWIRGFMDHGSAFLLIESRIFEFMCSRNRGFLDSLFQGFEVREQVYSRNHGFRDSWILLLGIQELRDLLRSSWAHDFGIGILNLRASVDFSVF